MGLQQNMLNETVRDLAIREPVLCTADDTLRVAIERMRSQKLGCVIVIDEQRKPAGMFTEGMLTQLLRQTPNVLEDPMAWHMAKTLPWVRLDDPIVNVLEAMQAKNVRFLCVVDEEGRVAGLTGQKGLMEYIAEHFPGQVMVQRVGMEPSAQREGA